MISQDIRTVNKAFDWATFHFGCDKNKIILCLFCAENSSVSGLILKYKEDDEMQEVKLTVVPSPEEHRKQSLIWLAAMQKVSDHCLNSPCNLK